MPRSSRRLPIIAGTGCLAVIACAAIFWEEIEARYYLHRLRGEPGYLIEILDRPEGTRTKAAVRRYLGTSEGKDALLRVNLGWHPDWLEEIQKPETVGVEIVVIPGAKKSVLCMWSEGRSRGHVLDAHASPWGRVRPPVLQAIQDLLPETEVEPRTLLEYPGLHFRLEASQGKGYTCTIERIPGAGRGTYAL